MLTVRKTDGQKIIVSVFKDISPDTVFIVHVGHFFAEQANHSETTLAFCGSYFAAMSTAHAPEIFQSETLFFRLTCSLTNETMLVNQALKCKLN